MISPVDERAAGSPPSWGSDAIAGYLRDLEFEYVALNPGASYRGLHDSIVNHLGNQNPRILLCLHEEHAVAIAHGYAKVSGRPMLAALHTNVGLMHATMAIFNAFCDRVPVVVLGSNGPVDAAARRPWIDWLHTSADHGALIRSFTKWDDEPYSIEAARESLVRAAWLAQQAPAGPVYVSLDVGLQERPLTSPDAAAATPLAVMDPVPTAATTSDLAKRLSVARHPAFIFGRVSRAVDAWDARVELAELTGARVITDLRVGSAFPTDHPLHAGPPGLSLSPASEDALRQSDLILAFDPVDLYGSLAQAQVLEDGGPDVISVSVDAYVHNGWSKDHQRLVTRAQYVVGDPDATVIQLASLLRVEDRPGRSYSTVASTEPNETSTPGTGEHAPELIRMWALGETVREVCQGHPTTFIRLPIGWPGAVLDFRGPLEFLGSDGGAGIGSGPGMAVGAALALRGTGRLPIAILGDGDFLMGCTALWTAATEGIGALIIVSNNRSYFNDELHQERVARQRARPVENRWVGQRIDGPPVDIAGMARAQGVDGHGPISDVDELRDVLVSAIPKVLDGHTVVVDVLVRAEYDPQTLTQMITK